jgi:hypothetical protein
VVTRAIEYYEVMVVDGEIYPCLYREPFEGGIVLDHYDCHCGMSFKTEQEVLEHAREFLHDH